MAPLAGCTEADHADDRADEECDAGAPAEIAADVGAERSGRNSEGDEAHNLGKKFLGTVAADSDGLGYRSIGGLARLGKFSHGFSVYPGWLWGGSGWSAGRVRQFLGRQLHSALHG
jgi:hypothetical protein